MKHKDLVLVLLLLTAYCLLFTAYCFLLTAYCLLDEVQDIVYSKRGQDIVYSRIEAIYFKVP